MAGKIGGQTAWTGEQVIVMTGLEIHTCYKPHHNFLVSDPKEDDSEYLSTQENYFWITLVILSYCLLLEMKENTYLLRKAVHKFCEKDSNRNIFESTRLEIVTIIINFIFFF